MKKKVSRKRESATDKLRANLKAVLNELERVDDVAKHKIGSRERQIRDSAYEVLAETK